MLDAENPAEAAEPTTPTQGTETAATEAPATESPRGGETAAPEGTAEAAAPAKKTAAKRTAKKATAKKTAAKKTTAKRTAKKATAAPAEPGETLFAEAAGDQAAPGRPTPGAAQAPETAEAGADDAAVAPAKRTRKSATKKTTAKRTTKKAAAEAAPAEAEAPAEALVAAETTAEPGAAETEEEAAAKAAPAPATALLFQPPDPTKAVVTTRRRKPAKAKAAEEEAPEVEEQPQEKPAKKAAKKKPAKKVAEAEVEPAEEKAAEAAEEAAAEGEEEQGGERRRRRRGGRRRRRSGGDEAEAAETGERGEAAEDKETPEEEGEEGAGTSRRRRRRRRGEGEGEEPRARKPRNAENEITALSGSTRLEAKKQRRREGREAGRRRAPIVSEAEFLARRESVDRVMVIRQRDDLTQIAVLEDKVLVEHYVSRESQNSLIGNVYLGRVQNVLPSMEAAFIDIGKGRNAVLYAGEVNWDALGHKNGTPRKIESVLKSGQSILVQVTKDPIGHKGARLTSQISLPGRFLVYVPDGTTSGISRKLPDTERNRLKTLLKEIVPESAGVIVRTAAEGASEDELTLDVERLTARWEDIDKKVKAGNAPQLLYGEPDLTLKVVRDLFTEDFNKLVIAGDDAWDTVEGYVSHVAPDLNDRLEKYDGGRDVFAEYRIDEQIEKALDRKVWLPSGGSLVIDRTEAMTVVDVNTGKFTGSGGNLEETVTKNNLEAAEEIVRQLRLRDIGGIIVVDFIDMVLESNRDLVLRRLVECLGRDRTRHQVAEVTSLGLVQMTRKRIGT
ncbi:MAG TPA: Rne/Rng family ribonuclease, partial [Nocardioidaceae bacterium]